MPGLASTLAIECRFDQFVHTATATLGDGRFAESPVAGPLGRESVRKRAHPSTPQFRCQVVVGPRELQPLQHARGYLIYVVVQIEDQVRSKTFGASNDVAGVAIGLTTALVRLIVVAAGRNQPV